MTSRAAARLAAGAPVIATAHFEAEADPFHPVDNPSGHVNLGTAENRLLEDVLQPLLTARRTPVDTRYGLPHGTAPLRAAVARLLGGTWHAPVDPDDLVITAGATAALDIAATVTCDPGDVIVVPAPYYSAFAGDLTDRSGARLAPAPMSPDTGFALDVDVIDRTVRELRRQGETVRAVALSSPANPHGAVYPAPVLRDLLRVAAEHDLDVISDEIHAHCAFGPEPFVSVLDPAVLGPHADRVHVIWGFAKDFGLSGLKVGVLRPARPTRDAARALAYFATVSTDTQALLCDLLSDGERVSALLAENGRRLGGSHAHASALLTAHGIRHVPASAGLSIWLDLRDRLDEPTFAAEDRLWRRTRAARVNVLPGSAFGAPGPGWFRLCHAVPADLVTTGIDRLATATAPSRSTP
ncbi:1-aminocyclopropane-1-carboxylate synthase [Saccharothrix saharensis]|uniref:1-aminocyclopropane-1-carboxylate synthase n=1 Tax=Saccharothrix saharensis TaxID=571190 RepID=A0A543JQI4_9PSEU|nr:aminotransferase class I/II-fold pyridoxal phosphate-dependent enzyme [Saccharothrix saharensis]TQM85034.1 1-aminocyclopropane-1-carboxylate synthase [Saccharothrix saharensis]